MGSGIQATDMKRKEGGQEGKRAQTIGGFFPWADLCGKEIQHVKVVVGSEAKPSTVSPAQLWPTCDERTHLGDAIPSVEMFTVWKEV